MDRLLDRRRNRKTQEESAINKARAKGGLPLPGQTLFQHSKPFKGSTR